MKKLIIALGLLCILLICCAGCTSEEPADNTPASSGIFIPGVGAGVYTDGDATVYVSADGSYKYVDKAGNVMYYNADGTMKITTDDGSTYTADEDSGSYVGSDGEMMEWHIDSDGNTHYKVTEKDGTVTNYYITKDGSAMIPE